MFKVASCLNLKVFDAWDVLVEKFLDSKAKIKKRKDFAHSKYMGKEFVLECIILSHHINPGFSFWLLSISLTNMEGLPRCLLIGAKQYQ